MRATDPFVRLLLTLVLAIGLFYAPAWLSAPLKWFEVFFHEFSHGLLAILTGGGISRIDLQFVGSGTCYYLGGWRPLVAFAGYAGASLWGWAIHSIASICQPYWAKSLASFLLLLIGVVGVLWVRDLESWAILGIMMGLLVLVLRYGELSLVKFSVEFVGLFIVLASIQSPLFLLDGQARGDGATLSDLTLVPELVWIGLWVLLGLGVLLLMARAQMRRVR